MYSERKEIDIKNYLSDQSMEENEHTFYTYTSNRHIHNVHLKMR